MGKSIDDALTNQLNKVGNALEADVLDEAEAEEYRARIVRLATTVARHGNYVLKPGRQSLA
jgi:hypothetical protein